MKIRFAISLAAVALAMCITSASAQSVPDSDVASMDWALVQAMQRAYDRMLDSDALVGDYSNMNKANQALEAVAAFQGMSIPQFNGRLTGPLPGAHGTGLTRRRDSRW